MLTDKYLKITEDETKSVSNERHDRISSRNRVLLKPAGHTKHTAGTLNHSLSEIVTFYEENK